MNFWKTKRFFVGIVLGLSANAFAATSKDQLFDHASMGSPLLLLIQNAKTSIDIEIYQMQDSAILSAVKAAAARKVRVRVIQEANTVGASCHVFNPIDASDTVSCVTQKQLVPFIRNHGGTYLAFSDELCGTPGAHCFQHGKILIVDGKAAIMSTGNFNASTLCDKADKPSTCNRDYSVLIQDPSVVRGIQAVFNQDLLGKTFDLKSILATVKFDRLTVSPLSMNPLVEFIRSAKSTIQLENQYLKDPELNGALIEAAQKGVKVFAMVASLCSFGRLKEPDDHTKIAKWTSIFTDFDKAGIHSRIFTEKMTLNGMPGYLHAKVILVDSTRAWVGSVNGSTTSLSENREYGIFTAEKQPVDLLSNLLYEDFVHQNSESWQESILCKKDLGRASPNEDPTDP